MYVHSLVRTAATSMVYMRVMVQWERLHGGQENKESVCAIGRESKPHEQVASKVSTMTKPKPRPKEV